MNPTTQKNIPARIERALERAREMRYKAHYLGTQPLTGAWVYAVRSVSRPRGDRYLVYAERSRERGGFLYARGGWWVRCTCIAGSQYAVPCTHAARVSLRLEREHVEGMRRALREVRPSGGELFEETQDDEDRPFAGRPLTGRAPGANVPGGLRLEEYFAA